MTSMSHVSMISMSHVSSAGPRQNLGKRFENFIEDDKLSGIDNEFDIIYVCNTRSTPPPPPPPYSTCIPFYILHIRFIR
jgi:hypothetical protein